MNLIKYLTLWKPENRKTSILGWLFYFLHLSSDASDNITILLFLQHLYAMLQIYIQ